MELKWISDSLVEVKGANDALSAQAFVEERTGKSVRTVVHVALSLYQVQVR